MDAVLDNFNEELARPRTHVDIMLQMLEEGGITREMAQHAVVASKAYPEMIGYYGFSERAAETYLIHGEQDVEHGARQIQVLKESATDAESQEKVRKAVKLGLTAYTLEWDGHVQAITGRREFWSGSGALSLRLPTVRLARPAR